MLASASSSRITTQWRWKTECRKEDCEAFCYLHILFARTRCLVSYEGKIFLGFFCSSVGTVVRMTWLLQTCVCLLQASESLSSVETSNFFWAQMSEGLGDWTGLGERTGFSDRTVRNFSQDVFKVLSQCIPSGTIFLSHTQSQTLSYNIFRITFFFFCWYFWTLYAKLSLMVSA